MKSTQVIVYSYNNADKLKYIIDTLFSLDLNPIIIDDGSTDNTYDVLRKYTDDIDKIVLDRHEGFTSSIISGIMHVIRGFESENIIIMNAKKDNPLYVMQLLGNYKNDKLNAIVMNNIKNNIPIFAKILKFVFSKLSRLIYGFDAKDHLSTYAILKTSFVKQIINKNETIYTTPSFLLLKIYLKASKEKSIKWINIDGEKETSIRKYIKSFKALF